MKTIYPTITKPSTWKDHPTDQVHPCSADGCLEPGTTKVYIKNDPEDESGHYEWFCEDHANQIEENAQ